MDEFLTMTNILTEDEAATLFDTSSSQEETKPQTTAANVSEETKEEDVEKTTTEIEEGENPFELEETEADKEQDTSPSKSESVGSEEEGKGKEGTDSEENDGTSSNSNFYSSIASALKEEGIFPDLDDSEIEEVTEPEQFRDLVQRQIEAGLSEVNKRINDALNAGVEPSVLKQYENTLAYLNNITEEQLNDESETGEDLRRRLLQQDFMNRGYSQDRATKMTEKLFASGEDIEEAKQALLGNKEYFGGKYKEVLDEAKEESERAKKEQQKKAEQLKKDILSSDKVYGEIPLDKATRQKIYENITKPVHRDKNTGEYYTALQKYRLENEQEYLKNFGLFYTLTDGFTNLEKLIAPTAKKEVKKKLKELEHTINNTSRGTSGVLQYVGNSGTSSNKGKSFIDRGFVLDMGK